MMSEKDYIKTLHLIRRNYKRDWRLCWDDMGGEYINAVEAIDKAIEALQDKESTKEQSEMTKEELKKKVINDLQDIYDYFRVESKTHPDRKEFERYQFALSNAWFIIENMKETSRNV